MSCHEIAYDETTPSLLSMCEQDEAQTYSVIVKVLDEENATNPHKNIILSKAKIKRIAAYICDPYAPAQ